MLQTFELSAIDGVDRLDVKYYLAQRRAEDWFRHLQGKRLGELCSRVPTKTPEKIEYQEDGVRAIKLRNVPGTLLNSSTADCVSELAATSYVEAQEYDLLVTATGEGTCGRADIYLEPQRHIVTGEVLLLRPDTDLGNPFVLLAILRHPVVANQLRAYVRGATGQTHLYWKDLKDLWIPAVLPEVEAKIENAVREAQRARTDAAAEIATAREIVARTANVSDFDYAHRDASFEVTAEAVAGAGRFDVEFHQPVFTQLEARLEAAECVPIARFAAINKATDDPTQAPATPLRYLDIGAVDVATGAWATAEMVGYQAPDRARRRPRARDVLVSTVRPARNAVAMVEGDMSDLYVSTGFAVVRAEGVAPEVLFAVLKTPQLFAQLARRATAAMYPAVTEADVIDTLMPDFASDEQETLVAAISAALEEDREADAQLARVREVIEEALPV